MEVIDLPQEWARLTCPELSEKMDRWQSMAQRLLERNLYRQALESLVKRWSDYFGFVGDLKQPGGNIDSIDISSLMGKFLSNCGELDSCFVRDVHIALTALQETYIRQTKQRNLLQLTLPHGRFKTEDTHMVQEDGHEVAMCPSHEVEQKLNLLFTLHRLHRTNFVSPDIQAAWLLHRFLLIHPFADGNGRVARCIANLVLIRESWLPLLFTKRDRHQYLKALRDADAGNLGALLNLIQERLASTADDAISIGAELLGPAC